MEVKLQVYEDSKCTKEIPIVSNKYQLNINIITKYDYSASKQLYIKNNGDRKAYSVVVTLDNDINGKLTYSINKTSIAPGEIAILTMNLTVSINPVDENKNVNMNIAYDYLP